jgi:hypothetical protein
MRAPMTINGNEPERCTSCILPRSAKHVRFNSLGLCQLCSSRESPPHSVRNGSYQLKAQDAKRCEEVEQITRIKEGAGRLFDCIVGISGGRDSSYLLYLLVRKHNLRCLAAYYRTPFTSEVIDENVKRLVNVLNVPLLNIDISHEFHRRIAREMVILWTKKPNPVLTNLACAPCKLVNRELFKIARTKRIRSIIYGTNIFEDVNIAPWQPQPADALGRKARRRYSLIANVLKTFSIVRSGIGLLMTHPELCRHGFIGFQSSFLYMNPHTLFLRLYYPHIDITEYFYHAEWNESHCAKVLKELGWRLPPICNTYWKVDCSFSEIKNYMLYETRGVTYIDAFFSNMVRAGFLSRDEALQRIEVEGRISWERIAEACRALELPEDFFASLGQRVA